MRPLPKMICGHGWRALKGRVGGFSCILCGETVNVLPERDTVLEPVGPPVPKMTPEVQSVIEREEIPSRMSAQEFRHRLEHDPDFYRAVMRGK